MYLITNRTLCSKEKYLSSIFEADKSKIDYLILREKDLKYSELEALYKEILEVLGDFSNIKIIVNSNLELYENYDVYGLHLPYQRFKVLVNEGYSFDKNKAIGLSLHSVDEVRELEQISRENSIKIDYITLSHIYETKCKEGLEPRGLTLLQEARKFTDIKLVALGGILPQNVGEVTKYCDDIAVMSTLFKALDVKSAIDEYRNNSNIKI